LGLYDVDPEWLANHNVGDGFGSLFRKTYKLNVENACQSLINSKDAQDKDNQVTTFAYLFRDSTSSANKVDPDTLTSLFSKFPNLKDVTHAFYNCEAISQLPDYMLANNTNITTCEGMFGFSNSLKTVGNIFDSEKHNKTFDKLKNISNLFIYCENLTTIPRNFFKYTTAVTNLTSCFESCAKLNSVPSDIFDSLEKLTNITNIWKQCKKLQFTVYTDTTDENGQAITKSTTSAQIPINLFQYNEVLERCNYAFEGCTTIYFPAVSSKSIFASFLPSSITTAVGLFKNCSFAKRPKKITTDDNNVVIKEEDIDNNKIH
jgi:hypothetical protein